MKLLSICVPTFNRTSQLKRLNDRFISLALAHYEHSIEFIVCDNSDDLPAALNKKNIDVRVAYHRNETNVGYAQNVINCIKRANGKFVWVISDDDPIDFDAFTSVIKQLSAGHQDIACLVLQYKLTSPFGEVKYCNTPRDVLNWDEDTTKDKTTLRAALENSYIPFILVSGAIVRNAEIPVELKNKFRANDYVQIPIFIHMVGLDGSLYFSAKPVIEYNADFRLRFNLGRLMYSLEAVRAHISGLTGRKSTDIGDYIGWLTWLICHKAGVYEVANAKKDFLVILRRIPKYLHWKTLVLAALTLMPKFLVAPLYLTFRASKYSTEDGSSSTILHRYLTLKRAIEARKAAAEKIEFGA